MGDSCGGCPYHTFPYKAFLPFLVNGKRVEKHFNTTNDIYDIIELVIEETENINEEKGKEFDIATSINAQLPFFTCRNHIFDKDIQRYVYCKDNNVPPYEGGYDKQPALWVDKYFLIKSAFAKKDKSIADKHNKEINNG